MKNVKNFASKFFKVKLKNNWKLEDFLDFFDLSEEEFYEKLKAMLSSRSYKEIVRELQKNSKIKEKSTADDNPEVVEGEEKKETDTEKIEDIVLMIEQIEKEQSTVLDKKEKYLQHKSETIQRIEMSQKALEDIKKAIQQQETVIQSCTDRLSNIESKLIAFDEQQKELDAKKEELLKKKQELEKVIIKVSGVSIECEVPVPENWRDMYIRITTLEEAIDEESAKLLEVVEMMNLKTLRQLSKILSVAEMLEKQKKSYKIVFDEESELAVALQMLETFEIEIIG